jgi:hypothetical protein
MIERIRRAAAAACAGFMLLAVVACGGGGSGSNTTDQNASPTTAVIHATALGVAGSGNTSVQAPLGSTLTLDGSASTAQGGVTSYLWTVSSRPAGSSAALQNASSAVATFVPDVPGAYQFALQVGDGGSTASAVLPVTVTNAVPVVSVNTSVSFTGPVSNRPPQTVAMGSVVSMDGTGSTDGGGGPVTLAFTMLSAPSGSAATIATSGSTAHFTPDVAGTYQVRVRATSLSGLYADAVHTFNVTTAGPTVVVATSLATVGTSSTVGAAVGNVVSLDAGGSWVPSGSSQGTWTIQNKPAGSALTQLTGISTTAVSFVPDVPGAYTVQYTLLDSVTGSSSFHRVLVNVVLGPVAAVSTVAAPVAQAVGPSYVGAVGSEITLRGSGSYDPNGEMLTFSWVLGTRPAGSVATLSNPNTAAPAFTPDKDGRYSVTLTVTNQSGLRAVQSVSLYVGNYPPVVVLDRSQVMVLLGNGVSASAAASYSQNGGTLTYNWALDSRPAGSNATIAAPNTSTLTFTPDVAGTYYASLTVTDGSVSAVSGVAVVALSASAGTVPLTYQPLYSRFSKALNKVVIVSTNPNQLHLVDPSAGTDVAISLPSAVKALSLSADGQLAGVLHEGNVSLVDLAGAALLHTSTTGGSQTEVFTANSGVLFVTGQTGGQWVSPAISAINGRTGVTIGTGGGFASIYGVTRGVMSESLGRLFTLSDGLSPSQVYWTGVDASTGSFTGSNGQSPYWGDYSMANPMWLSGDESLLFTAAGTYFRTSNLTYAGTLGGPMISVSHSASAAEAVALASNASYWGAPTQYPAALKRFTGSLLLPASDVPLPLIGGQQSYGLSVFHASDDKHVMIVQTGSNQVQTSGVQYFVVAR